MTPTQILADSLPKLEVKVESEQKRDIPKSVSESHKPKLSAKAQSIRGGVRI